MKNHATTIIYFFLFFVVTISTKAQNIANNNAKEKQILELVLNTLKTKHVAPIKLDDAFSKNMFSTYLESLDNNRIFFLVSDIQEFKKYELELDDQIKKNDLTFFNITRKTYLLRMAEAKEIYLNIFKNKLDFTLNEVLQPEKIINYPKNKIELTNNWNKYIKSEVLYNLKSEFNPRLTQNEFNTVLLDFENNNMPEILETSYYNVNNMTNDLVFEFYINALVAQFDDFSKYYLPVKMVEYKFKQSGKILGHGMTVGSKDGFIYVGGLLIGGPAWNTKKIEEGDVILKIGKENQEHVNITGYSIYEAIKLIRGIENPTVVLILKKKNGSIVEVSVKRDIVSTNDSYIKSSIVLKNNVKYAIISFPRFYNELDEDQMRNSPDDLETELQMVKTAGVNGIILDIRNNIGGSIEMALKIVSNFINKNNVVQFRNNENQTTILKSVNETKLWKKNVVLLVNSKTASSSEMIAATFQDQNIGVVIGEKTFGNMNIQEFLNLKSNNYDSSINGALSLSTKKFYKLNGKSVHKEGITPNISFGSTNSSKLKVLNNMESIIIDQVKGIEIKMINEPNYFSKIIKNSEKRISNSIINDFIKKNIQFEIDLDKINTLNSVQFKKKCNDIFEKRGASLLENYTNNLEFLPTVNDEKIFKKQEYLLQKRKDWYKSLKKDYQIEEGLNILEDLNNLKN